MRQPQVDSSYHTMPYLSRERWISFWYQILEVTESLKPSRLKSQNLEGSRRVLEVGPGPGTVARALKGLGIKLTTLDIDAKINPNVNGDITKLPFKSNSFDVILAAEILEHIPFDQAPMALKEMAKVAKKAIIITLPHFHHFAPSIALKVFPFVPRAEKVFPISILPPKHKFDGHYWEIGKKGYPLKKIKKLLKKNTGFNLTRDYLIEENPRHYMFVLEL